MGIFLKDPEADKLVRKLAKLRGVTLTEAIRDSAERALREELEVRDADFLAELHSLQKTLAAYPPSGKKADKAFFDWLSGEED
jgi:antitoxin VapB